jgi:hypothetical protein
MSYYGMVNKTLVADTELELHNQAKLYEHYPQYCKGKVWSTDKSPKFRKLGKFALVLNFFRND